MKRRSFVALATAVIVTVGLAVATSSGAATATCPDVTSCLASARVHSQNAATESQAADADLARAQSFASTTTSTTALATTTTASASTTTQATTTTVAPTTTTAVVSGGVSPLGVPGAWTQTFGDEFNGTTLDRTKWNTWGSWECCDGGRSNSGNGELDYKTDGQNMSFANGVATFQSRRETAPNGMAWTSAQLGSKQAFTYGYIETRAQFSPLTGVQPALWTWQAQGGASQETDTFEFYGDNHSQLYLTSHSGSGGGCHYTMPFDPTAGLHVYGSDIEPTGTTWYVDGVKVCSVAGHPSAPWNIVSYQVVLGPSRAPTVLSSTTHAEELVDYIRAWRH
jgi:beta-glucanase (GH16 family)